MQKKDVENYYVGYLNINRPYLSFEEEKKGNDSGAKTINTTMDNGAVSLIAVKFEKLLRFDSKHKYESWLSIFYRIDENHFMCLHNGIIYSLEGRDYCSDLVPLIEVVPKIDFDLGLSLTDDEAKRIFSGVFKKNNFTFKELHDINEFYCGRLKVCMGYTEKDKYHDLNVLRRVVLNANPILYDTSKGSFILEGNEEIDYINYQPIFLKISKKLFYNINDYQNYTLGINDDKLSNHIELDNPLSECLDSMGIKYPKKVTISKVLKLQKRIK